MNESEIALNLRLESSSKESKMGFIVNIKNVGSGFEFYSKLESRVSLLMRGEFSVYGFVTLFVGIH